MIGFDCETYLIEPGLLAPPLVCLTVAWAPDEAPPAWLPDHDPAAGVSWDETGDAAILTAPAVTPDVVRGLLAAPCVGANAPFDLLVLVAHLADPPPGATWAAVDAFPWVFEALAAGRVRDVQVRETLALCAAGRLAISRVSLADLVGRHLGKARGDALKALKGPDAWRVRYSELDGVPLPSVPGTDPPPSTDGAPLAWWPSAAVAYAIDDARLTREVFHAQSRTIPEHVGGYVLRSGDRVTTEDRELRAAWALHLQASWSLRTDPVAVSALISEWTQAQLTGRTAGQAGGWLRLPALARDDLEVQEALLGSGELALAMVAAYAPGDPPRTPRGKVCTGAAEVKAAAALPSAPPELVAHVAAYAAVRRIEGTCDSKVLRSVVSLAFEGTPPLTKPSSTYPRGQVKIDEETLDEAARRSDDRGDLESNAANLAAYAGSLQASRYLSLWAGPLRAGTRTALTYRVRHLLETGRVSIAKPPLQQPPRKGGLRPCFVARSGYALVSVDYDTAELRALAWVLHERGFGTTLYDALNAGVDVHCVMAVEIAKAEGKPLTYSEVYAGRKSDPRAIHLRQMAKVANFGFPGGLGAASFVEYARGQEPSVVVSLAKAQELRAAWLATWPEMRAYFRWIADKTRDGTMTVCHPYSWRIRGDVGYCDGCNGYFQGLVADAAKEACWDLAVAAYADPSSPFYGSRPALMLHDEVLAEVPLSSLTPAAAEMARIMRSSLQRALPGVLVKAEEAASLRWYKEAETKRDEAGALLPWSPVPTPATEGGR